MSLSKVYPSNEAFQPQDIVSPRPHKEPVWDDLSQPFTASKAGNLPKVAAEPATPAPGRPAAQANGSASQDRSPAAKTPIPASPAPQPASPQQPVGVDPQLVEQMVAEAYAKGVEAGHQQAEDDFGSATSSLLNISQHLDDLRETILKNSSGEMHHLAMAIAELVIRDSVQQQSITILRTVEEAIHKAVRSEEFYIFVNPLDYEIVQERAAEFIAGMSGLNNLVVKKDPAIPRGGCKIESDNCTVDATIGSQLEIIYDQLKEQR